MGNNENRNFVVIKFLLHLYPEKVDENTIKCIRAFGQGSIGAMQFFIMAVTGMNFYVLHAGLSPLVMMIIGIGFKG